MQVDITALYCCLDDFSKLFEEWERHQLITSHRKRQREGKFNLAEMLLVMILFHTDSFRNFKAFYTYGILQKHRHHFKEVPSYERFVILQKRLLLPMSLLLLMLNKQSKRDDLYIIDSSLLRVCNNKRIRRHKVFKGLAARGRTTMGWFFGFKLHLVINRYGEIVATKITPGNTDDRVPLLDMTDGLKGILLADKGYISKEKFTILWNKGLRILVGIRKNMINFLIPMQDKILLRKRFIIETVFGILKEQMGLEHSRHRSFVNAFVHITSCLVAYSFRKNKPKIRAKSENYQIS